MVAEYGCTKGTDTSSQLISLKSEKLFDLIHLFFRSESADEEQKKLENILGSFLFLFLHPLVSIFDMLFFIRLSYYPHFLNNIECVFFLRVYLCKSESRRMFWDVPSHEVLGAVMEHLIAARCNEGFHVIPSNRCILFIKVGSDIIFRTICVLLVIYPVFSTIEILIRLRSCVFTINIFNCLRFSIISTFPLLCASSFSLFSPFQCHRGILDFILRIQLRVRCSL